MKGVAHLSLRSMSYQIIQICIVVRKIFGHLNYCVIWKKIRIYAYINKIGICSICKNVILVITSDLFDPEVSSCSLKISLFCKKNSNGFWVIVRYARKHIMLIPEAIRKSTIVHSNWWYVERATFLKLIIMIGNVKNISK